MRKTPVEAECAATSGMPVEAGATAVEAASDPHGTCACEAFHRRWCASHPVIRCTPPELRVPLGIHGDGAGSTAGEKVFVMTWGGLAVPKPSTLDSRILFTCLRESEMAPTSKHPLPLFSRPIQYSPSPTARGNADPGAETNAAPR
jgi:hypothetical protein